MMLLSLVIIVVFNYNRGFIWQIVSFPLGVFVAQNKINITPKWHVVTLLCFIGVTAAILKKLPVVENNSFGLLDTLLQMTITYSLGLAIILFTDYIIKYKRICSLLIKVGGVSYSIYLAHVIPLDYYFLNPYTSVFLVYILVFFVCTVVLILFDRLINSLGGMEK